MVYLYFKLLGQPKLFKNDEEVLFSYTKIKAMLVYLFCNKQVNREEMATLLWPDKNSKTSRKNLRNCIYQANKRLGAEVIISHDRTTLSLNPNINIGSDTILFTEDPIAHLNLYQGPFLQKFYLKDSEAFEFWIAKMRTKLDNLYSQASYDKLSQIDPNSPLHEKEQLLNQLIELDEFEEKNYLLLMSLYKEQNRTGKVIETYYKLVDLLDRELGVSPSDSIQEFYNTIIEHDNNQPTPTDDLHAEFLFERVSEVRQLERFFQTLNQQTTQPKLVLIEGHTGSGKRTLMRKMLANKKQKYHTLIISCKRDDSYNSYQLIFNIIKQLHLLVKQGHFLPKEEWQIIYNNYFPNTPPLDLELTPIHNSQVLLNLLVRLLIASSQSKPFVFLVEEAHWIDDKSLNLLQGLFSQLRTTPIGLIMTKYKHPSYALDVFINQEKLAKRLVTIELAPLSYEDTKNHLKNNLKTLAISDDLIESIFQTSQGNPFLLSEYINLLQGGKEWQPLTPAIRSRVAIKLSELNHLEEELLDYLSCCPNPASISLMANLLTISDIELIQMVDKLCDLHILSQTNRDDDIAITFHQKVIQHFIYDNLSLGKRKILHLRLAEYLEQLAQKLPSQSLSEELAYHFTRGKEPLKALHHHIEALSQTLHFTHELFPIRYDKNSAIRGEKTYRIGIQTSFEKLWQKLEHLTDKYHRLTEFQILKLRLLYLEGRYLIRIGDYEQGIHHIQEVISKAIAFKQTDYLIEGYKQLIYYCIQDEQVNELQHYTEIALEAATQANNHEAIGITLRLRGLYYLISGQENLAKRLLTQSIDCFSIVESLRMKYAIQIAAALDYLAEIEQVNNRFEKAIDYQMQAINCSKEDEDSPYHDLFLVHLAISYYWSGQIDKALHIFETISLDELSNNLPWIETKVTIYRILLAMSKQRTEDIIHLLECSKIIEKAPSDRRDQGLVYYLLAKWEHYQHVTDTKHHHLNKQFHSNLVNDKSLALTHLNPYRDRLFIQDLEQLEKERS